MRCPHSLPHPPMGDWKLTNRMSCDSTKHYVSELYHPSYTGPNLLQSKQHDITSHKTYSLQTFFNLDFKRCIKKLYYRSRSNATFLGRRWWRAPRSTRSWWSACTRARAATSCLTSDTPCASPTWWVLLTLPPTTHILLSKCIWLSRGHRGHKHVQL